MNYVLAYDVGTSSLKAALVSEKGVIVDTAICHYPLQRPKPGWVEQHPEDYWDAVVKTTSAIVNRSKTVLQTIVGLVFSCQAMGIIPVDKDGSVLHPNITWVDARAEQQAIQIMRKLGGIRPFKAIVGTKITGKDVGPKLRWIKQIQTEVYNKTFKFLDVNGYLKYRCTNRMVAEWSGACSYGFNLTKKDWERFYFRLARIDINKFPEFVKSTDMVGPLCHEAATDMGLPVGIPVFGGCDDTQSAATGSGAIEEGQGHIYLGTSAWVGVSTKKVRPFRRGSYCIQHADPSMNLVVGVTEMAGGNLDWLIDRFYRPEKEKVGVDHAFQVMEAEMNFLKPGAQKLLFTPWFLGERCPVNDAMIRSTVFNLTHEHTRGHLARAQCEAIAFNLRWTIENMESDYGFHLPKLRVTGGASQKDTLMQALSTISKRVIETTSEHRMAGTLGAAMCAFVGNGIKPSFADIQQIVQVEKVYQPDEGLYDLYDEMFDAYKDLYSVLKGLYKKINRSK
jgi:xylulokinase